MKYLNVHTFMYVLLTSTSILFANDNPFVKNSARDCWLKVGKLCADQIKVRLLCGTTGNLQNICSDKVRAKCASFERAFTNSACVGDLKAKRAAVDLLLSNTVCAQAITTSLLCTTSLQAQNLCVNGNLEQCTCFKGLAVVDPDYTYTLGDPIVLQTILDDPCLNFIQTATEGTVFVIPRDGYYIVDLQSKFSDLSGATVITGAPLVENTIVINGFPRRTGGFSSLSFSVDQINETTSLMKLRKGDRVGGHVRIIIQDPVLGQIPYAGTVTLEGGAPLLPTALTGTLLAVHYLSSDCPVVCNPCQLATCTPVTVDCPSISVNCDACDINCCCEPICDDCECV